MPRYVSSEWPLTCHNIGGTHSRKALASRLLAYHGVEVMIEQDGGYTPTPVISHAILIDVCNK
jgi:phosphoglucomutase